ncbi:MAG: MlaD family protein, partial [Candidatus Muirbacterium halophilum]|nr:MlaD family protein [Candidatus Muirbacterium halophilum]
AAIREVNYIYVLFDNVDALADGSLIYFNGVNCGSVKGIEFYDRKIRVKLSFKKKVPLTEDIAVSIKTGGLIGEKYVDIVSRPDKSGKILKKGETIFGKESYSIDRLLISVSKLSEEMKYLVQNMNSVMDNNKKNIDSIFKNFESASSKTDIIAGNLNKRIDSIGIELENTIKTFNKDFEKISPEIVKSLKEAQNALKNVSSVFENISDKKGSISKSIDNVQDISDNIKFASEKVRKLMEDDQNSFVSMIEGFNGMEINTVYDFVYSHEKDRFFSDLNILFYKNEKGFFEIGVDHIGFDNDFNLVLGKRNGYNVIYGGIFDSRPGLGFGREFYRSKIKILNKDINKDNFNIEFNFDINNKNGLGIEYIDILDKKEFEFSIKTNI